MNRIKNILHRTSSILSPEWIFHTKKHNYEIKEKIFLIHIIFTSNINDEIDLHLILLLRIGMLYREEFFFNTNNRVT
jgi:hypothetical protein